MIASDLIRSRASLLIEPERHRLTSPEYVTKLGKAVVVAPHPDDETLGCGGLMALMARLGHPAHVLMITDGSRSHPHSITHPPTKLAAVREKESIDAISCLGMLPSNITFMRYPDCGLPHEDSREFEITVKRLIETLLALMPDTVLIPWRRDPHCDHIATWRLLKSAVAGLPWHPRVLEYPIWAWTQADGECAPRVDEGEPLRLDISPAVTGKKLAVTQYHSQLGAVIHDDPEGFVLKPETLAHFSRPWEFFIESSDV
jgi:LmbE family N-acetylglucosaminyl deacetylase